MQQWMHSNAIYYDNKGWETPNLAGEIILLVNSNSGLENKDFAPFVAEAGLCDAIRGIHGIETPNTQAGGSKAIDFILSTPNTMETIQQNRMLWFYDSIHSDHRGLFCDINLLHMFWGEIHQLPPHRSQQYHTKCKKRGRKYREEVSYIIKMTTYAKEQKSLNTIQHYQKKKYNMKLKKLTQS